MRLISALARFFIAIAELILTPDRRKRRLFYFALCFSGILVFLSFMYFWIDFDAVRKLKNYRPPIPSQLLDRKGRLISTFFIDNRIVVSINDMPAYLPKAFIAIEDNHFYQHHGVDVQGIARAAIKNVINPGSLQGGSTITQQVAKVLLTNRRRTLTRKFRELLLSLYLDHLFSKKEILNLYINQIYFGHGNYGVEAASRFYFGKSASEISVAEAAVLAGLPSAPNYYSPVRHPHISRQRSTQVLLRMIDMNFISRDEAMKAFDELYNYYANLNISPDTTAFGQRVDKATYFTEYMRGILEDRLGKENLYENGYKIYTSLDLDHQDAAQKALWRGLKEQTEKGYDRIFTHQLSFSDDYSESAELIRDLFGLPDFEVKKTRSQFEMELYFYKNLYEDLEILAQPLSTQTVVDKFINDIRDYNPYLPHLTPAQGALIEIDQKTGEVTAMVGGAPFTAVNQINRSVQMKRQPGSTFKPILYATAIDMEKITAASTIPDMPLIHPDTEGDYWIPENSSGGYKGFVTIREALVNSINMVSIAIAREIGLRNAVSKIAEQLHVDKKDIPINLTVALGSYEVSPLQMARAFSLFPRGGEDIDPYYINKIENADGKVIFTHKERKNYKQILQPGTAAIITSLLKQVVDAGTGRGVRSTGYQGFAAGKTGTTSHFRDAWFVGFNNRYTSAVWVGYDKPLLSLGQGQYGGTVAAPIWGNFQYYTQRARAKDEPYVKDEGTTTVEVCKSTGELPTPDCDETIEEYFLPGTEPAEDGEHTDKDNTEQAENDGENTNNKEKRHHEILDKKKLIEDIYQ